MSGTGWHVWFPLMLYWHHVITAVTASTSRGPIRWCCAWKAGFVAVYSSSQTTHSSPADVPAPLLECRIDEPSTQVSLRSLCIDKAIMHAFSSVYHGFPHSQDKWGVRIFFPTLLRSAVGRMWAPNRRSWLFSVENESQPKLDAELRSK